MNDIIKDVGDEAKILSERKVLKDTMRTLVNKKRAKIISKQEWWDLLYKHYPHLEKKTSYRSTYMTEGYVENEARKKLDREKKNNDFLPQLEILKGLNDRHLFTDDGNLEIEEERKCFNEMRNNIFKYLERMKSIINLTETEVICGKCQAYICMAKNLITIDTWYEITGFIGNFIHLVPHDDEDTLVNDYCYSVKKDYEIDKESSWISCSKRHIVGIYRQGKYLVNDFSNLELKFPVHNIEKWQDFYKEGYKKIKDFEEKCLLRRKKEIMNLQCELCHYRARDPNDFLQHIDKNNIHKMNITELIEEDF
jgi:hypothetical protein